MTCNLLGCGSVVVGNGDLCALHAVNTDFADNNSLAPLMSSAKDDWNTPENLLKLVRDVAPIGLDPCSNASSIVHAAEEWRLPDHDGLAESWAMRGLVYVNPPYGRTIGKWSAKMKLEASRGVEIIALLPARPDTKWFCDVAPPVADVVCFWRGRLTFLGGASAAPFPSVVAYYGPRAERFANVFTFHGHIWASRQPRSGQMSDPAGTP